MDNNQTLEQKLDALILEHQNKHNTFYATDDKIAQLKELFRLYEHTAADAIMDAQHFQTDMAVWLQGMSLCAQMVANGATHAEKDARMRGFIEMLESALKKVREFDYKLSRFNRRSYRPADLFENDYPVRHYKERAEEAERKLKQLQEQLILKPSDHLQNNNQMSQDEAEMYLDKGAQAQERW